MVSQVKKPLVANMDMKCGKIKKGDEYVEFYHKDDPERICKIAMTVPKDDIAPPGDRNW